LPELTYLEAVRRGLWEAMEEDERVILLGEDIGRYGGAFKLTSGFLEHFGSDRVIDTPIAEAGIAGAAVGAALMGLRPVAEMQYIDFIACAFNQITNVAAKSRYRWGGGVPAVIRGPAGGGVGAGPFHSQSVESYFFHTPGLKIVAPATARDARSLLRAAVRDEDPVLYLEHKALYRRIKEEVPEEDEPEPLGRARVLREGEDLSIVTYGAMVHLALEVAESLGGDGAKVEVLDLRTLLPLDEEALLATARRTGKVILLHEAPRTGGVGAELAARIAELAFEYLDGPLSRVAARDTPVPYGKQLERGTLPGPEDLLAAARSLLAY
jgi:2-oxoisovalerate dehydrogenase E1 component beta subunit